MASKAPENVPDPDLVIKENLVRKYEERHGKQLFVRFPHRLPEDDMEFHQKVHALSPLITKAHKPRQKYARFCLVDFKTNDDRNAAMKSLKKSIKNDDAFKGYVVSIPRTENPEFVQKIAEKKLKSLKTKTAKKELKLANKLALREKKHTSSIVVFNLPKSTSKAEVRQLFPGAIDIQMRPNQGETAIASVTLASTKDARNAVQHKLSFAGTELVIKFCTEKKNMQRNDGKTATNKRQMYFNRPLTIEGRKRKVLGS